MKRLFFLNEFPGSPVIAMLAHENGMRISLWTAVFGRVILSVRDPWIHRFGSCRMSAYHITHINRCSDVRIIVRRIAALITRSEIFCKSR